MKPFLIALIFAAVTTTAGVRAMQKMKPVPPPRKPVGMCQPYAEICPHCTDCTKCGHCAKSGGMCSACKDKPER